VADCSRNEAPGQASGRQPFLTQSLAAFVVGTRTSDIPEEALRRARMVVADVIACAAVGADTEIGRIGRAMGGRLWGAGASAVWQHGADASVTAAIFANASAATALDLDDGHRLACGHPAAGIVPLALALGEREGTPGTDLLAAIAIGYEIAVRVSASRDIPALDTSASGRWMAYACAATAARLLRLDEDKTCHALSIAGALGPNLLANGWSKEKGNTIKEGIPFAAVTGLMAAEMAAEGATGPRDALDNPKLFDRDVILPREPIEWQITRNYFKFYSACRHIHPAIDMALALRDEGLQPGEITAIEIATYRRGLSLNNYPAPPNAISAQYSFPYCVALALIAGREAVAVIDDTFLRDEAVVSLARLVTLSQDPGLEAAFPASTGAVLRVRCGDRAIERRSDHCSGDWQMGDCSALVRQKFRDLTRASMSEQRQHATLEAIEALASAAPSRLSHLLSAPDKTPA
jgi:2-methylcitrate dehydratase PrpD